MVILFAGTTTILSKVTERAKLFYGKLKLVFYLTSTIYDTVILVTF